MRRACILLCSMLCFSCSSTSQSTSKPPTHFPLGDINVERAEFSPDGKLLITVYGPSLLSKAKKLPKEPKENTSFALWDVNTGQLLWSVTDKEFPPGLIAFLPDNKRVLVTGNDRLKLCEISREGIKVTRVFDLDVKNITCLTISPNGQFALLGIFTKVSLFDIAEGKVVRALEGTTPAPNSLAFSSDGKLALASYPPTFNDPTSVRLWNVETGLSIFALPKSEDWGGPIAISQDGVQAVVSKGENDSDAVCLVLLEAASGKEMRRLAEDYAIRVAFSSDNKHLVTANGRDRTLNRWDLTSGKKIWSVDAKPIGVVTFSSDGALACTAIGSKELFIWDTINGKLLRQLKIPR